MEIIDAGWHRSPLAGQLALTADLRLLTRSPDAQQNRRVPQTAAPTATLQQMSDHAQMPNPSGFSSGLLSAATIVPGGFGRQGMSLFAPNLARHGHKSFLGMVKVRLT
jgi:hypothetical protein